MSDFAKLLRTATGARLTQDQALSAARNLSDLMLSQAELDGELRIPGLGTLAVKTRPGRRGHHPQTGAPLDIPARRVLVFRPAAAAKQRLA